MLAELITAVVLVILIVIAIGIGYYVGYQTGAKKTTPPETPDERERRRMIAEQKAFMTMIGYNADMAYGIVDPQDGSETEK